MLSNPFATRHMWRMAVLLWQMELYSMTSFFIDTWFSYTFYSCYLTFSYPKSTPKSVSKLVQEYIVGHHCAKLAIPDTGR